MAGIGFELRKLLQKDSYFSLFQTYTYAGVISSGPWILSIISLLIIGAISASYVVPAVLVTQFQTSVTYLIALSLIFTGFSQLSFTRYAADRIYEKAHFRLLPNLNGLLFIITTVGGVTSFPLAIWLFPQNSLVFRILFASTFVTLSCVWAATILLSGLKAYRAILINFAIGYGTALFLTFILRGWKLEGLMLAFLTGQFVLLKGILIVIFRNYPSRNFVEFDFLRKNGMYVSLIFTGFFYNLGIWGDKFVFWYHPYTGTNVVGPLNASEIYDLPIFMAYLSIIPGMAVFLVRMETDFVEHCNDFYEAVREGSSLTYIQSMKDGMVRVARGGIYDIIKTQATATICVFLLGRKLLLMAGIPPVYLPLLYIDVVGAGLQVVFLGIINIYFYLDRRRRVLLFTSLFALLNILFSIISIHLGPYFYGYGFAGSLCVVILYAMYLLDRDLAALEYHTFMLQ